MSFKIQSFIVDVDNVEGIDNYLKGNCNSKHNAKGKTYYFLRPEGNAIFKHTTSELLTIDVENKINKGIEGILNR